MRCEPDWPLQLTLSVEGRADVTAVVRVSDIAYHFEPGGTILLMIRGGVEMAIEFSASGQPGTPYSARMELTQRDEQIAAIEFKGTIPAGGAAVRTDRFTFDGPPASAPPIPVEAITSGHVGVTRGRPIRDRAPAAPRDNAEYTVFYATSRARIDPSDASKGYSADRSPTVDYGSCRVFIPKSHKIGSLGSPWWKRLLTMTDDRLRLLGLTATSADEHWQQIRARLASDGDAVVFVHGYNVSFSEAALRAAQIGFDLQIKGAMAFFSWPSQGTLDGYLADAATIEASEGMIAGYLSDFAAKSGATTVHVIAHSMGNRGVLRAVNRIAAAAQERSGVRFGQFILAAADVDADTFRQLSAAYTRLAERTTLYVSARDRAVEASRWLHHFPRAGLIPPVLILPQIDTINVTNADLTMLGHGYVAGARDVLTDMHALIHHGHPPQDRFGLRETKTESGERYWLIGA